MRANHEMEKRPSSKAQPWTADDSAQLYGIREWGHGYFDISAKGEVVGNLKDGKKTKPVSIAQIIRGVDEQSLQRTGPRVAAGGEAHIVFNQQGRGTAGVGRGHAGAAVDAVGVVAGAQTGGEGNAVGHQVRLDASIVRRTPATEG